MTGSRGVDAIIIPRLLHPVTNRRWPHWWDGKTLTPFTDDEAAYWRQGWRS